MLRSNDHIPAPPQDQGSQDNRRRKGGHGQPPELQDTRRGRGREEGVDETSQRQYCLESIYRTATAEKTAH